MVAGPTPPAKEHIAVMKSGLEIAQEAILRPIADVAADAGIEPDELKPYGSTRAKVSL